MFLLVLGLFSYLGCKSNLDVTIKRKDLLFGWLAKLAYSLLYLFVFTTFYGNGELYGDSRRFFLDSNILSEIAWDYPWEYVKLLFNTRVLNSGGMFITHLHYITFILYNSLFLKYYVNLYFSKRKYKKLVNNFLYFRSIKQRIPKYLNEGVGNL